MNTSDKTRNMVIVPINPNSLGVNKRASIIPTTKSIPFTEKLLMEFQMTPFIVFSFSDIYTP